MPASSSPSKHTCPYCGAGYSRESTLISHMCEKKRRVLAKDEVPVRLGFASYRAFHKWAYRKDTTYEDFMKSSLYGEFVRFGRYLMDLKISQPIDYAEYLIKHQIPLKDWCRDSQYLQYRDVKLKNMTIEDGITASLEAIAAWAQEGNREWRDFYREVHPNVALEMIVSGKITPMFLHCSSGKDALFCRFTEEQRKILDGVVNWATLRVKVMRHPVDVEWATTLLKEAGM